MAMLYPPYIEGKLPTQVGDTLRIPYQLNRAIGEKDLMGKYVHAQIKTVSTGKLISNLVTGFNPGLKENGMYYAVFEKPSALEPKNYYKIQLAFSDSDVQASAIYFSTVGVFKYTNAPQMALTQNNTVWTGLFEPSDSDDEVVREYCFDFYNSEDTLLGTSGWLLNADRSNSQSFSFNTSEKFYYAAYSVRTYSGYEQTKKEWTQPLIFPELTWPIGGLVKADAEEGLIQIGLTINSEEKFFLKGDCYLLRSCEDGPWEQIISIRFNEELEPGSQIIFFEDFAVEHGKTYAYALQQYDSTMVTEPFKLGKVTINFDDNYLYDGERQLKVKFNPKVSTFKTTMQESKLDTIGGKYPFFFRNGKLAYKEFPISGLISFHMDDNGRFIHELAETSCRTSTAAREKVAGFSTNLTSDIFAQERGFKLEVLEWLNNGKPKLFRSAAEGNYLVRLLNVSLSPEDRLGRMLHTFNATAYEVGECTTEELQDKDIIPIQIKRLNTDNEYAQYATSSKMELPGVTSLTVRQQPGLYTVDKYKLTTISGKTYWVDAKTEFPFINAFDPVVEILFNTISGDEWEGDRFFLQYKYVEEKEYPVNIDNWLVAPENQELVRTNTAECIVERLEGAAQKIVPEFAYIRLQRQGEGLDYTYSINELFKLDSSCLLNPLGKPFHIDEDGYVHLNNVSGEVPETGLEFYGTEEKLYSLAIGENVYADIVYLRPKTIVEANSSELQ